VATRWAAKKIPDAVFEEVGWAVIATKWGRRVAVQFDVGELHFMSVAEHLFQRSFTMASRVLLFSV